MEAVKPKRRGGSYAELVAALRENPGEWASLGKQPSKEAARNLASQITRGKRKAFEADGNDPSPAFSTSYDPNTFEVWVCYGEPNESA